MSYIKYLIVCAIFLFATISQAVAQGKAQKVDWASLRIAFEIYANYPTTTNAEKVRVLLPKQFHVEYTGDKQEQEALNFIYDSYQFRMLERQVLSGDRGAVRLAFNLMAIADGGFAEDLDIMLGSLIRINPRLFLEGLNEFRVFVEIDGLIGNLGGQYVDRPKAKCYEKQLRINVLSKVNDPKLKGVRDKCVASLRHQIKKYCEDV